ncbi:MAG: Nramp family divalent metal transporter [Cyclobacteriaceae bacterium]|nr:Nramp family divalent metal transporter [Cyclobacteriaceae bacterium]QOI97112.1 MAG: Nramp family divalent metal transporter [Flammeovirgaceae bacterium]
MRPPSKLSSVILYSVISAAFIGPGTITTAITAGVTHQLQLLWAVALGTLGCLVLQEASARIVISSGLNLGEASKKCFGNRWGQTLMVIVGLTVMLGCAAYEAGNILGAVAGLNLLSEVNTKALTVFIAVAAFVVLWTNKRQVISWLMTVLVGLMGVAFFILAFQQAFSVTDVLKHALIPSFPAGSALLILGLVGTTIVPYNIFLGSGISKGKTVPLMRIGLTVSVLVGGLITAAILIAGTSVQAFSSFPELALALKEKLGPVGSLALGVGLFAAGFSSAITAPYASSIIASTVFGWDDPRRLRLVWGAVLLTGFLFGISGIKPIPVILTVQALNGLILPLLVALLVFLVNSKALIQENYRQRFVANFILLLVFGSIVLVGLNQVEKVLITVGLWESSKLNLLAILSLVLTAMVGLWAMKRQGAT